MRKLIIVTLLLCLFCPLSAQDVIVKKDGATILSKVLEVNETDIKYKKFSNPNGPTYTIKKSDILSINYENGEMDTFADSQPSTKSTAEGNTFTNNPSLAADNLKIVQGYNNSEATYVEGKKKKDSQLTILFGLKEGSIIETPELKASFVMKHWYGRVTMFGNKVKNERLLDLGEDPGMPFYNDQYKIVVTLKNKTNTPIYIDLANSFVLHNNEAKPYYIADASQADNGSSNDSYSQRVISIPPMSSVSLKPQDIGQGKTWVTTRNAAAEYDVVKNYLPYFAEKGFAKDNEHSVELFTDLKRGEKIDVPDLEGMNPLSTHITYSMDDNLTTSQSMHMDFYVRQVLGGTTWNFSNSPLMFFTEKIITKLLKT